MAPSRSHGRPIALAAVVALLALDVSAFGDAGHRIVGFAAEQHLAGSRALREVRRILRPQESLADASVWADAIRSADYHDGDTALYRLQHPAHDTYHYTNVPFQSARYAPDLPGAHGTDIVWAARESIRVLQGRSQAFRPREALRVLAHLAGDIHQPLHAGNAFVSTQGPLRFVLPEGPDGWRSSLGGNALRYGPRDNFTLHSYWDAHAVNIVVRKQDPAAYAARLVREYGAPEAWRNTGDVETWPSQWASEALPLAGRAYAAVRLAARLPAGEGGRTSEQWRIEPAADYDALARAVIPEQLARGGYRLAATLRAVWPD